jgi:hypothetical protein
MTDTFSSVDWLALAKGAAIIVMLAAAAVLAAPKGRVPIAMKGLKRLLNRDAGIRESEKPASAWKRALAFALTIAAAVLAMS